MRILFVSPEYMNWRGDGHYPPIHLLYLSGPLLKAGYEVEIFDAGAWSDRHKAFAAMRKKIAEFQPQVIGITLYTPCMKEVKSICEAAFEERPEAVLVLGGGHPSAAPLDTLEKFPMVSFAMRGECDYTFTQLVTCLAENDDLSSVPGLAWRMEGKAVLNDGFGLVADIDQLKLPHRVLIKHYYEAGAYWHMTAAGRLDVLMTTRGCSFDCSFCFKLSRRTRFHSPDRIMTELEQTWALGNRVIHIMDDAFTLNRSRCLEVFERIVRSGMKPRIKIRSRVTAVDKELLTMARRAGVKSIVYGIESGSQKMLDIMNKKTTVADNERAIRLTKKAGIACIADVMMGLPGETPETMRETEEFLLRTKPIVGHIPLFYPLPTTRAYEEAKSLGILRGSWSHDKPSPWVHLEWAKDRGEIASRIRGISGRLYTNPGILWHFLRHFVFEIRFRQIRYFISLVCRYFFK